MEIIKTNQPTYVETFLQLTATKHSKIELFKLFTADSGAKRGFAIAPE